MGRVKKTKARGDTGENEREKVIATFKKCTTGNVLIVRTHETRYFFIEIRGDRNTLIYN